MPIPVALGVGAAISAAYVAISNMIPDAVEKITKEEFMRLVAGDVGDLEKAAITDAFAKLGLAIDPEQGLSAGAITAAINAGPLAGTGVELTNIFNRDAVKSDMQRIALAHAAQTFGLHLNSLKTEDVKEALRGYVSQLVRDEIAGGGDLVDAAPDLVALVKLIDAARKNYREDENGNFERKPLKMTPEAISNRERQAKYRAGHTRRWVAK